uniref:cysteine protease StiP family protein n=1 Tax=Eubacterium cellulosolvens TaxID=29322 RepID=UPI00047FEDEE|nr:cysteine protease StiP family protein [[Eubacterium] cellulosolvens]
MFGTYKKDDVTILLKDISGLVEPQSTEEREREIQNGRHYCEMLPIEYKPSAAYEAAFEDALERYSSLTANAVASVAQKIWKAKGKNAALVSLARAGTPIGILIKCYIRMKYGAEIDHYSISIIRGRGIDHNAIRYILSRHKGEDIQFVDGWTGKGAIQRELNKAMEAYPEIDPGLAVLSDPAYVAEVCGTHDDFLIASSCLNSTVSGLLSRTFLRSDIIGADDYHGAVFYRELKDRDVTYHFIEAVQSKFQFDDLEDGGDADRSGSALEEVKEIARQYGISDINLVKPSIGEATRVLLRRLPWKMLVHSMDDEEHLGHLYQLAKEKKIEIVEYPLKHYRACGIIKSLADT